MNRKEVSSHSRMISLFVDYKDLVKRQGSAWILDTNQKVAVKHVLFDDHLISLRNRISSYLDLTKHQLRKDFKGFIDHAVQISEELEVLDNRSQSTESGRNLSSTARDQANYSRNTMQKVKKEPRKAHDANRDLPPCPFENYKTQDLKHWISDCEVSTDAEKVRMSSELEATRAVKRNKIGNLPGIVGRMRYPEKATGNTTTLPKTS